MNDKQVNELSENLPRLKRFAFSLTGNNHDAEDLMQSTVERILSRNVPHDVVMVKWMYRICRNLWIDQLRSKKVRQVAVERGHVAPDAEVDGRRVVFDRLTLIDVNTAMEQLTEDQRTTLSLVAVEGLSYADAADVLEVPVGTVMSRVSRARERLSTHFSSSSVEDLLNGAETG